MHDLERFVTAQAPVIDAVMAELNQAQKRTHWMWFIFPQLRSLGRSNRARYYGIADMTEAEAYLAHPVLGPRLQDCTAAAVAGYPKTAHDIFGSPDDLKFRSCCTLFVHTADAPEVFGRALDLFYGAPDPETLRLLAGTP
ncbi:MAG: DUF1810 domain-containing protein [Paracoccaceae bacterium]